jgi:hypothetical protein
VATGVPGAVGPPAESAALATSTNDAASVPAVQIKHASRTFLRENIAGTRY